MDISQGILIQAAILGTKLNSILSDLAANNVSLQTAAGSWTTLTGSDGRDLFSTGPGHVTVNAGLGADLVFSEAGHNTLNMGDGDDVIAYAAGKTSFDRIDGGAGIDTILVAEDDTVIALSSIAGIENISADGHANVIIQASDWASFDFSLIKLEGIARIQGASSGETLIGSAAADVIAGGSGHDALFGGKGADTFIIRAAETGFDRIEGGTGLDTIRAQGNNTMIALSGMKSIETITADGAANVFIKAGDWSTLNFKSTALIGIDRIEGGVWGETIIGSKGNDIIIGGAGHDTLDGYEGDDTFILRAGETGFDRINGGKGFDTIRAQGDGTRIALSSIKGVEAIDGAGFADVVLKLGDWSSVKLSNIMLSGIARIEGANWGETISGTKSADIIVGGAGHDTLAGNDGNDTFLIRSADLGFDRIKGGAGIDTIRAEGDGTVIGLSSVGGIELVDGTGFSNVVIKAADWATLNLSQAILKNIDHIEGGNWGETLIGSKGNDVIIGASGHDTLSGQAGDDTFVIRHDDQGFDRISGGAGKDLILADGDGTVISLSSINGVEKISSGGSANVVIKAANWTTLDFTRVTLIGIDHIEGNTWGETLIGSRGNDVIDGGTGSDHLTGGTGNDTFIFRTGSGSDTITDFNQAGADQIKLDFAGILGFDDVLAHAVQQASAVRLSFGSDHITLTATTLAQLNAASFAFATPPGELPDAGLFLQG